MISQKEYAKRRQTLMSQLLPDSIAFIPAGKEILRNGFDIHFPFRQDSQLSYLTGFEEPQAVLVLAPGRAEGEMIMFNRTRNLDEELWTGARAGQEGACKEYGMDQAFAIETFEAQLPELLAGRKQVYYPMGRDMAFDRKMLKAFATVRDQFRKGVVSPEQFINVENILSEMRLHKSKAECDLMRYVCDVSAKGHLAVMQACKPGMNESDIEAVFKHYCHQSGCREMAYPPIVGTGKNACVLHYIDNNAEIAKDDLVLIDAGSEYHNYAADITRTFPANGKFNDRQKALYEVVLTAQKAAIKLTRPGTPWIKLQDVPVQILTEGLVEVGLLKGKVEDLIENKAYADFYPHRIGHWLGLDTHDVGSYMCGNAWRDLEPGMVTTIEPGLYVQPGQPNVDEAWWGLGVRIEDNVLVTEGDPEVFTHAAPKEIDDIEHAVTS
ncbi:MAG: aminopeptidase P N-terminal domain-containing protein [Gammaproteobacteria bacterium]